MTGRQLKNSILQLAVQGRLLPQNPADEPASVLLQKISKEKQKLIREGKIKKPKAESFIFRRDGSWWEKTGKEEKCIDAEIPFEIPESWEWVRLGTIVQFINGDRGKNYPSKDKLVQSGQFPFISALNIGLDNTITKKNLLYLSEKQYTSLNSGKLQKNDIVLCIRGSLGKFAIFDLDNGAIASSLVILRLFYQLNTTFLISFFSSILFFSQIKLYDNGTAQPNLSAADVKKFFIPLPPLAEQRRIAAKIDEIMPRIAAYEKAQTKLVEITTKFPDSFKKSILQTAIQGRLVPQDPADEPASVLLQKIRKEKQKLIRESKIKKTKEESFIFRRDGSWWEKTGKEEKCLDAEIPFEIPESWEWVRLDNLICVINYGTSKKSSSCGKIPVLRMQNLQDGEIDYSCLVYTNDENDIRKYKLEKDDLLFNRTNSIELVGKVSIFDGKQDAIFAGYLIRFKMIHTNSYFINYLMQSDYYKSWCHGVKTLGVSQANINAEKLKCLLIPLPPLAEQRRIAEKIQQFMAMDKRFREALES